jgi:hypothetical protein
VVESFHCNLPAIAGLQKGYSVWQVIDAAIAQSEGSVCVANGLDGESGWAVLSKFRSVWRKRSAEDWVDPKFPVVVTHEGAARISLPSGHQTIDLVQVRAEYNYFWEFEKAVKGCVKARVSLGCVVALFELDTGGGKVSGTALFPCARKDADELVSRVKAADEVNLKGMLIDASTKSKEHEYTFIVVDAEFERLDLSLADDMLSKIKSWKDIAPLMNIETEELQLDEAYELSALAANLYVRNGVPAFNLICMGPANTGKTTLEGYIVQSLMGGCLVAGTASSGKGWMITHKEGVPSIVYQEKNALLVDEFFKAVQDSDSHSYAMQLNNFLEKQMQIFERAEMVAPSGVGSVKGRMVCSFQATENTNVNLCRALVRAEMMADAPMRRVQFAYVDAPKTGGGKRFTVKQDRAFIYRKMDEIYERRFGPGFKKGYRALVLYSRRFTGDSSIQPPKKWVEEMMESLYAAVQNGEEDVPKEFSLAVMDSVRVDIIGKKVESFVDHHQGAISAAWEVAGVIRGWEVHNKLVDFAPVYDERQLEFAVMIARFLFVSKLRVFAPGADEYLKDREGVRRVNYGIQL